MLLFQSNDRGSRKLQEIQRDCRELKENQRDSEKETRNSMAETDRIKQKEAEGSSKMQKETECSSRSSSFQNHIMFQKCMQKLLEIEIVFVEKVGVQYINLCRLFENI